MSGPQVVAGSHSHGAGSADVALLPAKGAVLTVGADGVAVAAGLEIKNEKSSPFTCAVVNPEKGTVVLGDQNAFVKVYDVNTGEFLSMATRLTLPVRCLALSPGGATLAVAGDGEGIKLLSTEDGKVMRMLQSGPQVRDIAFDPEGLFVASVNSGGTIQVWDVSNGKAVFTVKKGAPVTDHFSPFSARLAWHPDGSVLAAPGVDNDVVLYERLSWEITNHLSSVHTKPVTCISMSPNGLYAITTGRDKTVVVWDTSKCEEIERFNVENIVTAVVWQPSANAVEMVDEDGCHLHWDSVVPEHLCSPYMSLDEIDAIADKAADNLNGAANPEHAEEDGMQEFIENDTEDQVLDGDARSAIKREVKHAISRLQPAAHIQSPVQQGQTPMPEGKGQRRFLTYTMEGFITSRQDDYGCTVEVGLHDVNSGRRRMPVYTDFYGFHLASFGENGTAYASSSNSEYPSTVMYRPFEFWAPKSDWTVSLPAGEEAECVVAGRQFVAVASSQRLLRIFSPAGLPIAIISLQGPPIALAAHGDELAVVWHSGNGIEGEQLLSYSVFNVPERCDLASGSLPLANADLIWLGYSKSGQLGAFDSSGILRIRTPQFGGSWTPVFMSSAERKGNEEYFIVGISHKEMYCIIGNAGTFPQVHPKPIVSMLPFEIPIASIDPSAAQIESQLLSSNLHLSTAHDLGENTGDAELTADRCALKLFQHALKAGLLQRALELACHMHLLPSIEGALRLASHHSQGALAERISVYLGSRQALDAQDDCGELPEMEDEQQPDVSQTVLQSADNRAPSNDPVKRKTVSAATAGAKKSKHEGAVPTAKTSANPFIRSKINN